MNRERRQRGATLITALVMLVVLTLLVVSAIRSSSINLRIVGNMQIQQETIHAAQQATDTYISNDFTQNPVASSVPVTINGLAYTGMIQQPVCLGTRTLAVNDPMATDACRKGNNYDPNDTRPTDCAAQQWDVATIVTDSVSGAKTTVHQGVSSIVPISTSCP